MDVEFAAGVTLEISLDCFWFRIAVNIHNQMKNSKRIHHMSLGRLAMGGGWVICGTVKSYIDFAS